MPSDMRREQINAYEVQEGNWIAFKTLGKEYFVLDVEHEPEGTHMRVTIQTDSRSSPRAILKFKYPTVIWRAFYEAAND